jgi:hypothetical protein
MNPRFTKFSIPLLRWTLGLVVLLESCRFVFSVSVAHFLAETGLPAWIRVVLGGAETIAAVLFLMPFATLAGSYLLLVVFAFAALVHVLHGQYDVGGLAVYAVAVFVCMTYTEKGIAESGHDRV